MHIQLYICTLVRTDVPNTCTLHALMQAESSEKVLSEKAAEIAHKNALRVSGECFDFDKIICIISAL